MEREGGNEFANTLTVAGGAWGVRCGGGANEFLVGMFAGLALIFENGHR